MPAAVNLLYAADYGLLPGFGDTLFANMERAWESLTPELQENLQQKIAFFRCVLTREHALVGSA